MTQFGQPRQQRAAAFVPVLAQGCRASRGRGAVLAPRGKVPSWEAADRSPLSAPRRPRSSISSPRCPLGRGCVRRYRQRTTQPQFLTPRDFERGRPFAEDGKPLREGLYQLIPVRVRQLTRRSGGDQSPLHSARGQGARERFQHVATLDNTLFEAPYRLRLIPLSRYTLLIVYPNRFNMPDLPPLSIRRLQSIQGGLGQILSQRLYVRSALQGHSWQRGEHAGLAGARAPVERA